MSPEKVIQLTTKYVMDFFSRWEIKKSPGTSKKRTKQ